MTVIRGASGARIDCDGCNDYAASPGLSIEVLRRATGFVRHEDRDWCPHCWREHAAAHVRARSDPPSADGPAA